MYCWKGVGVDENWVMGGWLVEKDDWCVDKLDDGNPVVLVLMNSVVELDRLVGGDNVESIRTSSILSIDETTIGLAVENGASLENSSEIDLGWKPSLITLAEYHCGCGFFISARHSCNTEKKDKKYLICDR